MEDIENMKSQLISLHTEHVRKNKEFLKNYETKTLEYINLIQQTYKPDEAQKYILEFLAETSKQTENIIKSD